MTIYGYLIAGVIVSLLEDLNFPTSLHSSQIPRLNETRKI